jgi:hypothetical protein
VVDLNRNNLVTEREINLQPGHYRVESGGAIEFRGLLFSFSSEQFFNPFNYELSTDFTSDLIITNFLQEERDEWTEIKYILNNSDLRLLKSLQRIEFSINSLDLVNKFNTNLFSQERYFLSALLSPYEVYAQKAEEDVHGTSTSQITGATLSDIIPQGSTILFATMTKFPPELFISGKTAETVTGETELDLDLLGDHQFYLVAPDDLSLSLQLNPYLADQLFQVQLRNSNGKVVCTHNYAADSSDIQNLKFNCDTEEGGIYILSVRSQRLEFTNLKSSFEINRLEVNTDKIMVKDRIRTLKETKLYAHSVVEERIEIFTLSNSSNILVQIDGELVEVSGSDDSSAQDMFVKNMPRGDREFSITQKGIGMSGTNFAFNKESLFDPYSHYIVLDINANPDYIVSDITEDSGFYLKSLSLDVK